MRAGRRPPRHLADSVSSSPPEDEASIRRKVLIGVTTVGLRGLALRLFGLLGYLLTARLLAPEDFGLAALGLSITFAAHFLAEAGIGAALLRQEETPHRRDYAAVVGVQVAALTAAAAAAAVVAVATGSKSITVTAIFLASLPLVACRTPAGISLERELRFGPSVKADVVEVAVYNAWIVGGALLGWGVFALATGAVVRTLVGTIVLNHLAPVGWVMPTLEIRRLRGLIRFGLIFQATSGVGLALSQVINLGTAAVAGYAVLGLWAIAGRLVSVPALVFDSLMRVSFPAMARLQRIGTDLAAPMERQVRRSTILAGVMLAPTAVAGPSVLPVLLGDQWAGATDVIPFVFAGFMVSQPISVIASGYLLAAGQAGLVLRAGIAIFVAQVVVTAITLPTLGYVGLGLGALAGGFADGIVLARGVLRHSGARLLRAGLPGVAAFAPAVGVGLLIAGEGDGLLRGAGAAGVSLVLFAASALLLDRRATLDIMRLAREIPGLMRRQRQDPMRVPEEPVIATAPDLGA